MLGIPKLNHTHCCGQGRNGDKHQNLKTKARYCFQWNLEIQQLKAMNCLLAFIDLDQMLAGLIKTFVSLSIEPHLKISSAA